MMQHGSPEDRTKVISLVKQNLVPFAKHKFASNVVERCLEDGSVQQRRELMEELASKPDALYQLIRDSYGNYVIRKCFCVFGEGGTSLMLLQKNSLINLRVRITMRS